MFLLGFICGTIVGATAIIAIACSVNNKDIDRLLEENYLGDE